MGKILKPIAAVVFAAFVVGVFGLVVNLTFSALGRIFPDNYTNQLVGVVLFDLSCIAWGLAFVYQSKSIYQYAFAALGFLVGLAGTVTMVASEVILSSADLQTPPPWIGQTIVYGFIVTAVAHLVLAYAHKASSPEIDAAIRLGAAQAEITSEAIRQAEDELERKRGALGDVIRPRLIAGVKRDLRLPLSDDEYNSLQDVDVIEGKATTVEKGKVRTWLDDLWTSITAKDGQEADVVELRSETEAVPLRPDDPTEDPTQEEEQT